MVNIRLYSTLFLSLFILPAALASAATQGELDSTVDIRFGRHNEYVRVVVEGPHSIITKGKVKHDGNIVKVTFDKIDFLLKDRKLPIKHRKDKNSIIFEQENINTIKLRNLTDPSRLVIDFYTAKEKPEQEKVAKAKPEKSNAEPSKEKEQKAASKKQAEIKKPEVARIEPAKAEKKKIDKTEVDKKEEKKLAENVMKKEKVTKTGMEKAEVKPGAESEPHNMQVRTEKKNDQSDFVPEHYKKFWTLLETGNYYGLLTALPEYKPEDARSVAVYHYMYGAASYGTKHYLNAIDHLRLAYIYSTNQILKEKALSLRAKTYMSIGLYQEARADYMMLIDTFPSSKNIRNVHLGLADSLSKMGEYRKAVKEYERAGDAAVVLYSKANALQQLEQVKQANALYKKAKLADETYPEKSQETYYLIGENMRMSGELEKAKQHISRIISGPYRDSANISLGLISLKEGKVREAINKFLMASKSNDRKVNISGLFNLALANLKHGKIEEATKYLEILRHDYVDSYIYKDTLLALAKIYRKKEQTRKSLSLLKELVYGKQAPQDAFNELEAIILDSLDETEKEKTDKMNVADIWKEVGQWLVDEKREKFLITVSESLRNYGMPFIELSEWLIKNASQESKGKAALNLADYYAGIGENSLAKIYIAMAMNKKLPADDVLRVEVKILNASGKRKMAIDKLVQMENILKEDVVMLGNIIFDIHNPESETVQKGIDFYKKILATTDWDADVYIRLADILDASGRVTEAIEYYRIAHNKNPDDEWAIYRIGRWSDRNESEKMFSILQNGDSLLSRIAKTELTGMNILSKVNEVY